MVQDRIGTALMILAAMWMASLAVTEPGVYAETSFRVQLGIVAFGILAVGFFPRHLNLTGTVLAFAVLGLSLNIGLFGLFSMEILGVLPSILLAVAIWLRRDRLDSDAVVVISAVVACGLGIVQPAVLTTAFTVVLLVNGVLWLPGLVGRFRREGNRARP